MREQIVKIRTVANQFDALLFHPLPTASFSLHTVTQGYTYYGPRLIRTEVRKPRSISRGCAHVRNALRKCPLILTHLQLAGYLQNNARHRTYSSMLYCTGNWLKSGPKHATTVPYILSVYSIRPPYLRLRHLTPPWWQKPPTIVSAHQMEYLHQALFITHRLTTSIWCSSLVFFPQTQLNRFIARRSSCSFLHS